jgi:DNA-binding CsgD family transcriptional regulator
MAEFPHPSYLSVFQYNSDINLLVKRICNDFFTKMHITYFCHGTFLNDGTASTIITSLNFLKNVLEDDILVKKSTLFSSQVRKTPIGGKRTLIWTGTPSDLRSQTLYEHGVWHGISIIKRSEDKVQYWGFGTDRDRSMILNDFINNPVIFEDFMSYFKEKASDIVSFEDKSRLLVTGDTLPMYDSQEGKKVFQLKNYFLKNKKIDENSPTLSARELEGISYLAQGKTIKEAALVMHISPKTLEHYLQNAKLKINCHRKSDLIQFLMTNYNSV